MITKLTIVIVSLFTSLTTQLASVPTVGQLSEDTVNVLASREFSMANRYAVPSVNEVMKKNILLNLAYMDGTVKSKQDISWELILSPRTYTLSLNPGETFAYHEDILPEYADSLVATTNSIFGAGQGYLSDGYLYGDGVCHLASLLNWAAQDAQLEVLVTKDHRSVGPINEVPDDYGVSIYIDPVRGIGERNNLYITNNRESQVTFVFTYDESDQLKVEVVEKA